MNQTVRFIGSQFCLMCVCLTTVFISTRRVSQYSRFTKIAEVNNYSTDDKRDIFNTFETEDKNDQGFPIDPFELMNRLKQVGGMDNATTPSDALDEALNAFDQSEYENVPNE